MGRWIMEGQAMRRLWWSVVILVAVTLVSAAPAPSSTTCPLNFTVLDEFPFVASQVRKVDALDKRCLILSHGLDVLLSVYLKQTGYFLPPPAAAESCIQAVEGYFQVRNITGLCGLIPASISRGTDTCQGIITREDFRTIVTDSGVASSLETCKNGVLANGNTKSAACAACTKALTLVANNFDGNTSECLDYTAIYTGAEIVTAGPADATTLVCLWDILSVANRPRSQWWLYLVIGAAVIFLIASCAWGAFLWVRRRRGNQRNDEFVRRMKRMLYETMGEHGGGLTWYNIEELRAATRNFDVNMIIGQGGFGNVYKGILGDGQEVACKRFKDCSAAGDKSFLHEVQALAAVRHRNLVALRGCCIASLAEEGFSGHQRIIVLDYVKNGSLQDHLFPNNSSPVLTWLQRHKIATDTARGLQYLHAGAEMQILHRDIKPSNILLDEDYNAKVADFGLVKFTPNGMTHQTTCVAGSFGYVAPEYAMYNQLTDRSDVYSFGIVLLELLSGRKAMTPDAATGELLIDWAWRLMKEGNWREILDHRMVVDPALESFELERFVMLALLCAHPHVSYRPTMTAVLRMLENAQHVPPLPDRPVPVTFSKEAFHAALATSSVSSLQSGSFVPSFSSAASV